MIKRCSSVTFILKDFRKVNFVLWNGVEIFNVLLLLLMKLQLLDFVCVLLILMPRLSRMPSCLSWQHTLLFSKLWFCCCYRRWWWRDRFKRFVRVFVWFYLVMINLYYAENASFFSVKYLIMCMLKSRALLPTTAHYYWYKARNF